MVTKKEGKFELNRIRCIILLLLILIERRRICISVDLAGISIAQSCWRLLAPLATLARGGVVNVTSCCDSTVRPGRVLNQYIVLYRTVLILRPPFPSQDLVEKTRVRTKIKKIRNQCIKKDNVDIRWLVWCRVAEIDRVCSLSNNWTRQSKAKQNNRPCTIPHTLWPAIQSHRETGVRTKKEKKQRTI